MPYPEPRPPNPPAQGGGAEWTALWSRLRRGAVTAGYPPPAPPGRQSVIPIAVTRIVVPTPETTTEIPVPAERQKGAPVGISSFTLP